MDRYWSRLEMEELLRSVVSFLRINSLWIWSGLTGIDRYLLFALFGAAYGAVRENASGEVASSELRSLVLGVVAVVAGLKVLELVGPLSGAATSVSIVLLSLFCQSDCVTFKVLGVIMAAAFSVILISTAERHMDYLKNERLSLLLALVLGFLLAPVGRVLVVIVVIAAVALSVPVVGAVVSDSWIRVLPCRL